MQVASTDALPWYACLSLAMDKEMKTPQALFGFSNGAAWVAADVFVTRLAGGNLLVERLAGGGVRSAVVPAESQGLMQVMWTKLNQLAVDVPPFMQA
jgi:hypothetical protein